MWYTSSHFILFSSWFLWEVRCIIFFENLKRVKNRRKSSSAGDWPTDESLVRILPKFDDIRRSLARVANSLFLINSSRVSRFNMKVDSIEYNLQWRKLGPSKFREMTNKHKSFFHYWNLYDKLLKIFIRVIGFSPI